MAITVEVRTVSAGLDQLFEGQPPTMTAQAVADLLGLSKQAVYHWLRDGVVPGYKVGATWLIVRDELKATLQAGSNLTPKDEPPEEDEET